MNLGYDLKTLAMFGGLVSLVLAIGMGYFSYNRELYPGFKSWLLASLLNFVGMFLISIRNVAPDFFTVIIANLSLVSFYILILIGIDKFTHTKSKSIYFNICAMGIMALFFLYFTYISPSINDRIVVYSLTVSAITATGLFTSIKDLRKSFSYRTGIITFSFSFICIWFLIRAIQTYWFEELITDYLSSGVFHQASFIFSVVINIMIVIALIAITSERLRNELISSNQNLEKALSEVKVLRGIIPICSFCKKIRNDEGYYEQVEAYVTRHSEAAFSHTFCPECAAKHYPEFYGKKET